MPNMSTIGRNARKSLRALLIIICGKSSQVIPDLLLL